MAHPLLGAGIGTPARLFREGGGPAAERAAPDLVGLFCERPDREPPRRIRDALEIEGCDAALPGFPAHLEPVRGQRRHHVPDDDEARRKVSAALGRPVATWGCPEPDPAGARP